MKVNISYVTDQPLKIGTPIIHLQPESADDISTFLTIDYIDEDTNELVETKTIKAGNVILPGIRQYYTKWKVLFRDAQNNTLYTNSLNLENKTVFIKMDARALGDNLAWIDYVEQFRLKHKCKIICSTFWNELFTQTYPEILFVAPNTKIHNIHAQYYIGTTNDQNVVYQPSLYLDNPLQKIATDILGLDYHESKPKINYPIVNRKKKVCISEYASLKVKEWNIIGGWQAVVDLFVSYGYEVVVISKEYSYLKNVTNKSGDYPLEDRIKDLAESQFFIGNSSGLSWLAWGCDTHVILISDFTPPYHEPTQNYTRIYNKEHTRSRIVYEEVLNPASKDTVLQIIKSKLDSL